MNLFSGIIVFTMIWWMVFFCLLPFNIKTIDRPVRGEMPGAPLDPGMKMKVIITTIISCALWGVAEALVLSNVISFREMATGMRM